MAEALVKAWDSPVDSPMAYRRGEVVAVKPDRWPWARKERDPKRFYIVRLPGVDPDDLKRYLEPLYETDEDGNYVLDEHGLRKRIGRRRFYVEGTPQEWQDELEESGTLERSWTDVRDYVHDQVTGRTEIDREL